MEDTSKILSEVPVETPVASTTEEPKQIDMVAHATYLKTLNEAKKAKQERDELREFKKQTELAKLEAEGKQSEVIAALREELSKTKAESQETTKKIAFEKFSNQVQAVAKDMGCQDNDLLMMLMGKDRMAKVELDDKLNANKDDLKRVLEEIKAEKPILFGASKMNHTPMNIGGFKKSEPKSVAEMSKSEIEAALRNL